MRNNNLHDGHVLERRSDRWRFRLEETYGWAVTMNGCRTVDDVHRCLLKFFQRYGAKSVVAGLVPPTRRPRKEHISHVLLDGWPKEWSNRYFSRGYLDRDPTIQLVRSGCSQFHWNEIRKLCAVCPIGRRIMDEAREHKLGEGITFSFPTRENVTFGFSIAAERLDLAESDRSTLQFAAAYGLGCALVLAGGQIERGPIHLSSRQLEVISWASEGLTVDEIAARLNVSTHTADMHLRTARARLGVANTAHAVAESLRRGLIS